MGSPTSGGFARLLAAEGVSNFGSMLSGLAIPWLAALSLAASPLQMSALVVADVATGAVAALLLGGFVDRAGKRRVMLACDGARALTLSLLAVAAWQGWLAFWLLVVAAAASGALTLSFELARSAWIAQRIEAPNLPTANSRMSVVASISETAAFALGGWIYQLLGATLALLADAASYVVSAGLLRGVAEVRGPAAAEGPARLRGARSRLAEALADMRTGLATVRGHATLWPLAGVESLLAFGMSVTGTAYMIYVARDVALPTGQLGTIFALGAIGSLVGASAAPRIGRRLGSGAALTVGLAVWSLGALLVPLATQPGWAAVALLVGQQIVGDAGYTVHDIHSRTLRQTAVGPGLLARADAGIRAAAQSSTLAGALVGGLVGSALGARAAIWLGVGVFAAAAALAAARLAQQDTPGFA